MASELRGYKVLDDGRKTSYFHNELTKEERELLGLGADGNLAPKAISAEDAKRMEDEIAAKVLSPRGQSFVIRKCHLWLDQIPYGLVTRGNNAR